MIMPKSGPLFKALLAVSLLATGILLRAQGTGLVVTSSNTVGVGTSTPAALLDLSNANNPTTATSYDPGSGTSNTIYVGNLKSSSAVTALSGATTANFQYLLVNPSGATSQAIYNSEFITTIPVGNSTSFSSTITGVRHDLFNYGSGFTGSMIGGLNLVYNIGAGSTVPSVYGNFISAGNANNASQNSITTNVYGYYAGMPNSTTNGLISNRYGIYVTASNSGTVTHDYGLYLTGLATGGTHTNTPYDVYAADSGANNYFAGNVGIGTASPATSGGGGTPTTLEIEGKSGQTVPWGQLVLSSPSAGSANDVLGGIEFASRAVTYQRAGYIYSFKEDGSTTAANGRLEFGVTNGGTAYTAMTIKASGNVGIGTTSPGYLLDVAGQVHATSFVSSTTTYADFVFKPDYQLASLNEVEALIKKEGHLPGIPSEEEARVHGIDLTQMQVKLLQKIEELTLHQIEQEKRLNEQSKDIVQLRKENAELRERLSK